ncbi:ATP-binding protein [Ideonella sp.]|uniref:ATP-binding protein n=1 Tax=Ideonella sp. TaxID=1929293 RepID=UPI002B46AC8B|nr:ATP-binding protein [Ideonella sp.]HJV67536.1 ATP-binding protein [Ideonella sp.]
MKVGIRQRIVLVLVGVLSLSTALNALVASYFTNQQNEQAAFAGLRNDLLGWQADLQALTRQLQGVAIATVGDVTTLDQLAELMTLEFNIDDPARASEHREMKRTLGYRKTVSIGRLQLALRTGGFSGIEVYSMGRLSHTVSPSGAGMSIRNAAGRPVWVVADADAKGDLPLRSWPAWKDVKAPAVDDSLSAGLRPPGVSILFPPSDDVSIEVVVPVQGFIEDVMTDAATNSIVRFFSELSVVGEPGRTGAPLAAAGVPGKAATVVAVVVFRKRIDRAMLESIASKTAKAPALLSPSGGHARLLDSAFPVLPDRPGPGCGSEPAQQCVVSVDQKSYYVAFQPLQLDGRTQLVLGLAAPRDGTLANIRQTVYAILLLACATMLISVALGLWWVKRFTDPVAHLTAAVKRITDDRREGGAAQAPALERLGQVDLDTPGEVGALARAFNDMLGELQRSFETLEQRVQARTAELRQQARYLRTLIDMLPMRAWFKDTESRFLAVNQAEAQVHHQDPEQLVGKAAHDLWPREQADAFRAEDIEVMRTRQRKMLEESEAGPGGIVWREVFKAPVIDEDGSVLGTVGVARDISERKAAEAAREAALAEARRLAQLRSEFLAQMSHELRTPLNGVLGFAQLLQRDQALTEAQAKGLRVIEESGAHLLRLIDDILDLARIDAAKLVLYPSEVNLPVFLQAVCDVVRIRAEEKGLIFTSEAAPGLPEAVNVDEQRLRQVLLNLLSNAIKFTDRGQVMLRVQAQPAGPQGDAGPRVRLHFEVQDTGIGLSAEQAARLFQPFEQVSEAPRRAGGTGLGLAICRQLVRLMGGDVAVQSQPGEGSVFWFEIEVPVGQAAPAAARPLGRPTGYRGPRRTVLVVDDVEQNRLVLYEGLKALGFEVIEASDGQECLDVVRRTPPDLVLMDVMMPVMDGPEATRRLRQLPGLGEVPIVATSASVTPEVEAACRAAGANAFVPKPIDQNRLLDTLASLMNLAWVREAAPAAAADDAALVYPPPDEMQELRRLARIGNMGPLRQRAEQLGQRDPRYAPFAARLARLASEFQTTAITALVERQGR